MPDFQPDPDRIALGIRQPWAELILRGIKTIEVRSQSTNMRGPIYIYASQKLARIPAANTAIRRHGLDTESLPRGWLVGSVEIVDVRPCRARDTAASCVPRSFLQDQHGWQLVNPVRFETPISVKYLPYGVWFYPFKRRKTQTRRRRDAKR